MMWRLYIFTFLIAFGTSRVHSRSLNNRERRDTFPISQMAATDKQLGGGLSALGTLVSPLLFLMGMGSFISMLPQMFQSVLSGVGSNLIQSFTGANAAGGGTPSSSRLRRSLPSEDDILNEIERRFNLAVLKYEGHIGV
ncbi:hypothetical protein AVEN_234492-1 [Araneus ventricosus]|uniref:Uncharacterized protein n=1 Tax=Araneus ventricosus TaxID=182803 RepID=A0A4Y2ABA5_ARAVE|nr:hypothetical protein AVEN_234492-1 [Araneus ventricosus]